MLLRALDWIEGHEASLAILCKVAVVRRVLRHAWSHGLRLRNAEVRRFDATKHCGASVDACLFVVSGSPRRGEVECAVYDTIEATVPSSRFGLRDGDLVAELELYERWKHLAGPQRYRWRSGVKHDCSKVMEPRRCGPDSYVNGFQEEVQLEPRFLFPMLKSSEVANGTVAEPTRWMLVTQSAIGSDTSRIEFEAPRTWKCLGAHANRLDSVRDLLCSDPAQEFLRALTFWDSKRPITVGLLSRLDLMAVARELGTKTRTLDFLHERSCSGEQLELL